MKMVKPSPAILIALSLIVVGCTSRTAQISAGQTSAFPGAQAPSASKARLSQRRGAQVLKEMQTQPSRELTLASDIDIPELRELARAWAARTETISYEMTLRDGVPARIAVRQIQGPNSNTVYVCIHGLFGESANWKYVAAALCRQNEVWALDLIGSGLSDCPDPSRVGPAGYGPEALAERALQALQARLAAHPEVSKIIIAGHSLGGMITLRMFMNDDLRARYSAVLNKVGGLALFAPCDVSIPRATESWITFMGIDDMKAGVGSALRVLQYQVAQSVVEGFCRPQLASRELAQSGIHMVRQHEHREAMKAIMRAAIPWRVFGKRVDHKRVKQLETGYAHVQVPCLIVWGKDDETLPTEMGYKIMHDLPDARLVVIPDTMHLLPLERPAICADLMRHFHSQLATHRLSAARTVQTLDPVTYERNLLAVQP